LAEEEFEATFVHVIPIFASLVVSVFCAFLILQSHIMLDPVTVFPEKGYGPVFNAAIFVLASGAGATMIYFLLKHNVQRLIRLLMAIAFSILAFFLVIFYAELTFAIVNVEVSFIVSLSLAFLTTIFVLWEVFLRKGRLYVFIVLPLGGATGTLLGASIPTISTVLILLLLAVYDVIAVFRGPIGKIAAKGLENLPGASFSFKNINVGLGDLVFYSMLVSHMFLSFGWEVCAAAIFGVLMGSFLSFKMVEKKGMFPGLPFSILFGLLASVIILWI